ncbi:hypothetical protein [Burkholderia cepacia]|nr:hypothetical protein [Burkholderia cepacia]AIO28258.1 hypothetical protein DM41_4089 [Burkholderia cepacia ATCC 25416]MCA8468969.1 hypothetical protein [Burkholderia cepacia]QCY07761.1 hypothetical protein EJ998_33120 [Burkholderia cepacia ATCC 25416]SPU74847.1 Uncharacterised protein [Burkholderia cepacia]
MMKLNFQFIEMKKLISNIGMLRKWRRYVFALCFTALPFDASAQIFKLQLANVANSYGACSWRNNGDGTSTINVTINYRTITGNLGKTSSGALAPDTVFNSRGILIYTYDRNGKLNPSSAAARYVALNGVRSSKSYEGMGYVMYHNGRDNTLVNWGTKQAFTADVEVNINNSAIKDWPGVAIRAGNYTYGDDIGEITGAAYLNGMGSTGSCKVVNPTVPPPPPPPAITIDMAAPDWNLGELPRGEGVKTLATPAQQLCFTYTGVDSSRNFVINATNANGVSGNRYLLKNISKPKQAVPYSVTLDSGSATFPLPNSSNSPVRLNNGNRTCFVPTFKTSVDTTADTGDYSDVLSFTIVTKS